MKKIYEYTIKCQSCLFNNCDTNTNCNHLFCLNCILQLKDLNCPYCKNNIECLYSLNNPIFRNLYNNNDFILHNYNYTNNIQIISCKAFDNFNKEKYINIDIIFDCEIKKKQTNKLKKCYNILTNKTIPKRWYFKNIIYDINNQQIYFIVKNKEKNNINSNPDYRFYNYKISQDNTNILVEDCNQIYFNKVNDILIKGIYKNNLILMEKNIYSKTTTIIIYDTNNNKSIKNFEFESEFFNIKYNYKYDKYIILADPSSFTYQNYKSQIIVIDLDINEIIINFCPNTTNFKLYNLYVCYYNIKRDDNKNIQFIIQGYYHLLKKFSILPSDKIEWKL